MKNLRMGVLTALAVLVVLTFSRNASTLETVPVYRVTEIGSQLIATNAGVTYSTALAVNESGDAAGMAILNGVQTPFLYTAERGPVLLPRIGIAAQAVDLTDRDVDGNILLVGTANPGTLVRREAAVLWIYSTQSGSVVDAREIGVLPGFSNSVATAVNNHWVVVGYSTNYDFAGSPAMKYDVHADLLAPFGFPVRPVDVNDFGEVTGGGFIGDLNGNFSDLGAPAGTTLSSLLAINDLGWTTGRAVTSLSDGSGRRISASVRHTGTGGWQQITANSSQDTGTDINYSGDVVGTTAANFAFRPFLYVDALDTWFLLDGLLAADFQDRFVARAEAINDIGQIAGSGTGGAVLLSPTDLPVPPPADVADTTAPTDPVATPAPAEAVDTVAPTVSILSPSPGDEVSGRIDVVFQATDNEGLAYVEINIVVDSSERVACSESLAGELSLPGSCRLNLRKIPAGSYPVNVLVSDTAGNWGSAQVTINVVALDKVAGGGCGRKRGC